MFAFYVACSCAGHRAGLQQAAAYDYVDVISYPHAQVRAASSCKWRDRGETPCTVALSFPPWRLINTQLEALYPGATMGAETADQPTLVQYTVRAVGNCLR